MDTPRIRTSHAYGEVAPNTFPDFEWVREHRDELLEEYGECIILVYEKKVIGTGDTYEVAVEDAERNLPPDVRQVTPILYFLHHRRPFTFLHIRPDPARGDQ